MSASYDFSGKKVLVTGTSKGIGRKMALMLADAGADVVAMARSKDDLELLVKEDSSQQAAASSKGSITALAGDVTASLSNLGELLKPHLPFDALVNNAGMADLQPVGELTEDSIESTFMVNFRGAVLLTQIVTNAMRANGISGVVVNVSSQASLKPLPNHLAYCASKAALDMAMRVMALELGKYGIRINSVNPTVVFTDMGRAKWSDPATAAQLLDHVPLGRFCEIEEVVRPIMFLLSSDGASMTTGHSLPIDGGWTTC